MKKLITFLIIRLTANIMDMPNKAVILAIFALSKGIFLHYLTAERCLFTTVNFCFDCAQHERIFQQQHDFFQQLIYSIARDNHGEFAILI